MRQHKYIGKAVAALSATAALLAISCCFGPTQARYENHSQWQAIYAPQQQILTSDRLVAGGQKILLSDWVAEAGASRMEGITVTTNTGTASGVLRCSADKSEYLQVSLDRTKITANTAGAHVQLTMTPTAAALQLAEPVTVAVQVEYLPEGEAEPALWATYQMELSGVRPALQQEAPVALETLSVNSADSFAWTEKLCVTLKNLSQADTLKMTMGGGKFSKGTRYTHKGNTFLLGEDLFVEIPVDQAEETIVFDFSLLARPQSGKITLQAQTATAAGEITVSTTREALSAVFTEMNPVLTGSGTLTVPVCVDTKGLVWRLEMLTETEEGIAYTQSDEQYYLVVTISEDTANSRKMITISNDSALAPAGTYRLTLERLQDETVISSLQTQFFVCY